MGAGTDIQERAIGYALRAVPQPRLRPLMDETEELISIITTIIVNTKRNPS